MGEVSEAGGDRKKRDKIKISRTLVFVKTKVQLIFIKHAVLNMKNYRLQDVHIDLIMLKQKDCILIPKYDVQSHSY